MKKNKHITRFFETPCPEKYNEFSLLMEVQLRMLFGQLWQRDALSAKKELGKIFEKGG